MKVQTVSMAATSTGRRMASVSLLSAALLSGCYVIPHYPSPPPTVQTAPIAPLPLTFSARLYPSNDLASPYGTITAQVTNELNGRGKFSTTINGEQFLGEATRSASANREGQANGAGNRGGYINCRYQMNSSTLGSGQCRLSNGAQFNMHIGG